jgi:hypothetical protein
MPVENSKNGRRGPLKTGRFFTSFHGASFIILVFDEQPQRRQFHVFVESYDFTHYAL